MITIFSEEALPDHTAPRLCEEALAQATARFAVPCTDVVFVDCKGRMVLTKRRHAAAQGWWWMGGALSAGLTITENIGKLMQREIGMMPEGVTFLEPIHHVWADCRERPGARRDDIILLHYVQVPEEFIVRIKLDPEEYDIQAGLMRFDGTQEDLRPILYYVHGVIQKRLA